MYGRTPLEKLNQVKITMNGASHSMSIPSSIMRALGWVRGDQLAIFIEGGDLIVRNDSKRAARFTRQFGARKENHVAAEAR